MHRRSSYLEVLPTSCTLKFYCWQKRQNVQIEQIAFKFYQHLVSSSSTNILYLQVLLLTEETEYTEGLLALKLYYWQKRQNVQKIFLSWDIINDRRYRRNTRYRHLEVLSTSCTFKFYCRQKRQNVQKVFLHWSPIHDTMHRMYRM